MTEYYEDIRYLTKKEALAVRDPVVVRSIEAGRAVSELYQKDGIRIGKLDMERAWAGRLARDAGMADKGAFVAGALCD